MKPERLSLQQRFCRILPPLLGGAIARRVFLRNRSKTGEIFVTRTLSGGLYSLRAGDLLGDHVRMCGFWDWRVLAIAAFSASSGDIIVEIGANTGTETVGFASIVESSGRVVSFEPVPACADAVRNNAQINGYQHVKTVEAAVTDFSGSVHLVAPSGANSGQAFISRTDHGAGIDVPAVTLDSMTDELGPARLVLIDVEGFETAVLRGGRAFIHKVRPMLIVEAVANQLARAGSSLNELAGTIAKMEYTIYQIDRFFLSAPDLTGDFPEKNWLCVPRERNLAPWRVNLYLLACALISGFLAARVRRVANRARS